MFTFSARRKKNGWSLTLLLVARGFCRDGAAVAASRHGSFIVDDDLRGKNEENSPKRSSKKRRERGRNTHDNMNNNNNNNNNSKEETGRDTPQLYSAIVGGEGQDFVATTLSTSAQVRRETERTIFFFSSTLLYFCFSQSVFAISYFLYLCLFLLCDAKEIESAKMFSNWRLSPMFVLLFSNRSKRRCKKSNPRAR